ncbi:hypothetical protein ACGRHY_09590 [Streptomyces sp. HK10]|uniref:hypothetical protein n=1 Tax=Streptomyces sp. HK10 TaxID=3373255 RepID=UPI0037493491
MRPLDMLDDDGVLRTIHSVTPKPDRRTFLRFGPTRYRLLRNDEEVTLVKNPRTRPDDTATNPRSLMLGGRRGPYATPPGYLTGPRRHPRHLQPV